MLLLKKCQDLIKKIDIFSIPLYLIHLSWKECMKSSSTKLAILSISIATLFWGTTYPTIKFGLTGLHIPPMFFLFIRFLVAIASMLPLLAFKKIRAETLSCIGNPNVVILGLLNGIAFSFQFLGQVWATAGVSTIMVNTYVLFAPLFVRMILKERIRVWQKIAIIIGFTGVLLISIGDFLVPQEHRKALFGTLLVLVCGIVTGLYVAYSEKIMKKPHSESPVSIFFASSLFTLLLVALGAASFGDIHSFLLLDLRSIFWVIYLGTFCTSGAFILYLYSVRVFGAVNSAVFLLAQIVISIVLSVLLLDERLNGFMIAGGLSIFVAIWLVKKPEKPNDKQIVDNL
jgi:drug/metabolite transporter (DMT)-like permease